ncbi:MAG TPA: hypothetical protein VEH57_04590 [Thermoplasmata archaeon]|nr:hypothetical protein [Thermoplasmata archaeon]
MSAVTSTRERGITPFFVFGLALVVGAAWAFYMSAIYYPTPNFVTAALPTILGEAVAVAAILAIALWAPKNE